MRTTSGSVPTRPWPGALARLDEVAEETEAVIAALDLDQPVPVPKGVPWFPDDLDAWSVRWVLLHLDRGDRAPCRPRRHRAGVDRRRDHLRAHGRGRGLARDRLLKPWEPKPT